MDFRIDFEDGFGNRSWDEEDETAVNAAKEVAKGMQIKSLPPFIGIRIKPFTEDLKAAVQESDLITTDVWVSMGDEGDSENRIKEFNPYQVSPAAMDLAKKDAIFLHCLPAIRGQEVSEDMLEDPRSKVWVQAENRLHAQKALLLKLLDH